MQNIGWKSKTVRAGRVLLATVIVAQALTASAATLYVWQSSPSPAPPYATWASAATNIQIAIDAATAGDVIVVTNGVYATGVQPGFTATSNRVVVNKAVTVRSANGPAHTLIAGAPDPGAEYGPGSIRCVSLALGARLDGFTLTNGYTTSLERGGGAWCETGATMTNCVITGNHADGDGGGVHGGTLYRCLISNNVARSDDGRDGDGGGADHATLYHCVVRDNRGRKGGGVDDCVLHGCAVIGNNARVRGGGAARSVLYQCTVVDNHSTRGGGVSQCDVYSSIVYHNRAPRGPNDDPNLATVFRASCVTPLPEAGANNIALDPQLASWTHLSSNSPCRGTGENYAFGLRDIDGQAFGNPPSMGADELVSGQATGPLSVVIGSDFTNVAAGFAARFKLAVEGQTTRTRWDFGDGTLRTNLLVVNHAWAAPGTYPVRLTAWNDASGAAGVTATTLVNVVMAPVAYVDRANATPSAPHNSWATAATNIQDAIAVGGVAGRVIWVTNGVYDTGGVAVWGTMTNRVALSNGVAVRSVNGPRFTILRGAPSPLSLSTGDGAIRCAYVSDGSVLDGFTLTNGYTRADGHVSREAGGGGAWCESRGTATNCVFTGNTAAADGGGANGGLFFNCTFMANTAQDDGGAVDDAILYDCTLTNNTALWGGGASEAELHRCTVVGNSITSTGGLGAGAFDSALHQCVVTGNFGGSGYGGGAARSDLFNCVIRGNRFLSGSGAGAYACILVNCTVVENSGGVSGGAVVEVSQVRNSIVYYNSPADLSTAGATHSCAPRLAAGAGNLTNAPLFVDLAAGNHHLRPGSPCIDTGTNLSALVSSDFNGLPRPLDGNRDGTAGFDMGAYEFNALFFTSITNVGNNTRLCWFDTLAGMQLQAAPSLNNPVWTNVPFVPRTNCTEVPLNSSNTFFRLVKP